PRKMYLKAKTGVDRVAGSIVSVLGLKLIFFK
ncbi:LysE family translocator, partial [Acinetobacter baumannii]|nr:LysE family translocator [Acinetobacter baumannii]